MEKYEVTFSINAKDYEDAISIIKVNNNINIPDIVQLKLTKTDKDSILYIENQYKKMVAIMGISQQILNNSVLNIDVHNALATQMAEDAMMSRKNNEVKPINFCNTCKYLNTSVQLMSNPPQYRCTRKGSYAYSVGCSDIYEYTCDLWEKEIK